MSVLRRFVRSGLQHYGFDVVRTERLRALLAAEQTTSNRPIPAEQTVGVTAAAPANQTEIAEDDYQAASQHYEQITGLGDMDPGFLPVYEKCRRFSMTSAQRMFALYKAIIYIEQAAVPGSIVECGVWRGGSMMVAAETLLRLGAPTRTFHLFDTYEGLPEPDANDVDIWGHEAAGWWREKRISDRSSEWALAGIDEVCANLRTTSYPEDRMFLIKGMVEDTIPAQAPEQIALLRLDTDWYASTKHELEHLFPRLSHHGVLIIDDYGHFKGAKKAVDEYIEKQSIPLLLVRVDYTGRIAIKTHG